MSAEPAVDGYRRGLEGVVAARTRLSDIDGANGALRYAGFDVAELSATAAFEDVCFLLWHGRPPNRAESDELSAELASYREAPRPVLRMLASFPRDAHPMTALRTAVSALGAFDPDAEDGSPEAALRKSKRLVAQTGVLVAAWHRIRQGRETVKPDPKLGFAADFLRQLHGRKPRAEQERLLESALITCAEHGLNPSTFAARVTASTLADVHAAVTSAIAALQGTLHGGASQAAMELLLRIEDPAGAEAALAGIFARNEKVPGFGHRVYAGRDPRAAVFERLAEPAAKRAGESRMFALARKIEEIVHREQGLHANVEWWSAPVWHVLRIPPDLFTAMFAVSRVSGWTAHALEQRADNRVYRPQAKYEGPPPRAYAAPAPRPGDAPV
jgi:citrate synthase